MKGVKAQVTLFVILGIVLLTVVAFALYIRNAFVEDRLQTQAEELISDFIQTNSINYFVLNCLERVTNDALIDVGLNAGQMQVGSTLGDDYLTYTHNTQTLVAPFALVPNDHCQETSPHLDAPLYPYPTNDDVLPLGFLSDLDGTFYESKCFHSRASRSGFFGYQLMPGLCDPLGENSFTATNYLGLRCKPADSSYPREETIQWQLQEKVSEELKFCANFSLYQDLGHDIGLNEEEITTKIIYGIDQTTSVVTFPFSVNIGGREPIIVKRDFSFVSPIRLRSIYEFVSEFLASDAKKYFWEKSAYTSLSTYDPAFDITILPNACTDCQALPSAFDDIVRIEDASSAIDGQPYLFHFAIKNRAPALDYIHPPIEGVHFDVSVIQGESITLKPQGWDPDDTEVTYEYSGWKETQDAYFDFNCCVPQGDVPCPNFENCVVQVTSEPRLWSTSPAFSSTQREATYATTVEDTGPHTTRVTISSEGGLLDYQDIRILVYDLPLAVLEYDNSFPTLNNTIASIEDPYTLDGTQSRASVASGEPISSFSWRADYFDGADWVFAFSQAHDQPIFILPYNVFANATMATLHNYPFRNAAPHNVELTVVSGEFFSDPDTIQIDVNECIPHQVRTGSTINEFSYPYNRIGTNEFSYDHTCCQGTIDTTTGTLTGPNAGNRYPRATSPYIGDPACFIRIEYGSPFFFSNLYSLHGKPQIIPAQKTVTLSGATSTTSGTSNPGILLLNLNYNDQNDIYRRDFNRYCDGTRGNICSGNIDETDSFVTDCLDLDPLQPNEDERCQGPAYASASLSQPSCIRYDYNDVAGRQTFETAFSSFGVTDANNQNPDGICNDDWQCLPSKDPLFANYKTDAGTGPFTCQAGCYNVRGDCSRPVGCSCDSSCGAICTQGSDSSYDTSDPNNPICSFGCNLDTTCNYNNAVACNSHCINDPTGATCPQNHNPANSETCHSSTNPCRATGCTLDNIPETLRQFHCDICTPTGVDSTGSQYCPLPGTIDGTTCYFDSVSSADSFTCDAKICQLSTAAMPASCPAGTSPICNAVSGPGCA